MNSFFKKNEKYTTIAIYAIVTSMIIVLLTLLITNLSSIANFFQKYSSIFSPILYALIITFLCNPLLKTYETYLFHFGPNHPILRKYSRLFSLVLTIITIIILLGLFLLMIIPTIVDSFSDFSTNIYSYITSAQNAVDDFIKNSPIFSEDINGLADIFDITELSNNLQDMIGNVTSLVSTVGSWVVNYAGSFVNEIKNLLIGFFLSCYVLASKEKFLAQAKKILYSIFSRRRYLNIVNFGRFINKAFSGFIVGKVIDSFIIGVLSFICFAIAGISYSPLMALIIGVTNIIPVFGPFVGGIIGGLLLLIIQPNKVVIFVILVLLIQQLDGNVIGPKILGDTVGISSIWVLLSILIFGGFFGITGMIIGVPIMAVIYAVFSESIKQRLRSKNRPVETEFYISDPPLNLSTKTLNFIPKDVEVPEITGKEEPSNRIAEEEALKIVARKRMSEFTCTIVNKIKYFLVITVSAIVSLIKSIINMIKRLFKKKKK